MHARSWRCWRPSPPASGRPRGSGCCESADCEARSAGSRMEFRKELDNCTIFGTLKIADSASILTDCREKGLIMPSQEVENCLRKPSTRSWEKIGRVAARITVFVLIAIIFVIAACRLSNGDFAGAVVLGTVACLGGHAGDCTCSKSISRREGFCSFSSV